MCNLEWFFFLNLVTYISKPSTICMYWLLYKRKRNVLQTMKVRGNIEENAA